MAVSSSDAYWFSTDLVDGVHGCRPPALRVRAMADNTLRITVVHASVVEPDADIDLDEIQVRHLRDWLDEWMRMLHRTGESIDES